MATYQKLPQAEWGLIRERYENGESPRALAAENGVSESTLHRRRSVEEWMRPSRPSRRQERLQADLNAATAIVDRVAPPGCDSGDRPSGATLSAPGGKPLADSRTITQDHLAAARRLRHRISRILQGETLGASPDRQPQAVKDLAMALERIQKIERAALGLDQGRPEPTNQVVIIIPEKKSPEDWARDASGHAAIEYEDAAPDGEALVAEKQ